MVNIKAVVGHLANGTFGESLCLICLGPLEANCENIFTKICKEDDEFCVADALGICQMEFSESDNYNICVKCFTNASTFLHFYFQVQRSKQIIEYYTEELLSNTQDIKVPQDSNKAICVSLPVLELPQFEFNIQGIGKSDNLINDIIKTENKSIKISEEDKIVMIIQDGVAMYFKLESDGAFVKITENEKDAYIKMLKKSEKMPSERQRRRKRPLMNFRSCPYCPVKYRFQTKLKRHMKSEHNIELYICKICKASTESKQEYYDHIRTHTNIHQCDICNMVFKRRGRIVAHLQQHDKITNMEGAHVCEVCGMILEGEDELLEHREERHEKKYTCYYCGKMYKAEAALDIHIRKHEAYMLKDNEKVTNSKASVKSPNLNRKPRKICSTCGKDFVDQRALLWHQRLHTNERPYQCTKCDRAFISLNRRNQHMICAHSAPTKGCPLCPALFHLRSMVNTHIKKVHLTEHKRRNKNTKYRNVFWRTEAVPIQELSVSVQSELLQMQTQKKINSNGRFSLENIKLR